MYRRNKLTAQDMGFGPGMDLVISLFAISIIIISLGANIYHTIYTNLSNQIKELKFESPSDGHNKTVAHLLTFQEQTLKKTVSEKEKIRQVTSQLEAGNKNLKETLLQLELLQNKNIKLTQELVKAKTALDSKEARTELYTITSDPKAANFKNNAHELTTNLKQELRKITTAMKKMLNSKQGNHIVVEGYASYTPPAFSSADESINMWYAMMRVNNVSAFFLEQGLAMDCISGIWYGRGQLDSFTELKKRNPNFTRNDYNKWVKNKGNSPISLSKRDLHGRVTVSIINRLEQNNISIKKNCIIKS